MVPLLTASRRRGGRAAGRRHLAGGEVEDDGRARCGERQGAHAEHLGGGDEDAGRQCAFTWCLGGAAVAVVPACAGIIAHSDSMV
ncbi:unnamed protein product [Urochloa humidicola]